MSLGIDYSSSSSESDTNESNIDKQIESNESELSANCKTSVIKTSIANPFDSNNYDQSSSSSDDDSNDTQLTGAVQSRTELSSALSVGKDSLIESINSKVSIFSNPFKEEQNKQINQLERHVKMSDNKKIVVNEGSAHKSICWNYHKHGKCKFGNRCRFQHNDDSNLISAKRLKTSESNKTRTGITDSLIPPAKALKTYYSQKNE